MLRVASYEKGNIIVVERRPTSVTKYKKCTFLVSYWPKSDDKACGIQTVEKLEKHKLVSAAKIFIGISELSAHTLLCAD